MRSHREIWYRNNVKYLTNEFYIENYLDKIEKIMRIGGDRLLGRVDDFELGIYSPVEYEMNITPVVNELLKKKIFAKVGISLPKITGNGEPLIFRRYNDGDELIPSRK